MVRCSASAHLSHTIALSLRANLLLVWLRTAKLKTPSEAQQANQLPAGHSGVFRLNKKEYPVHQLDLPTHVESFKTYDDRILEKTSDGNQMLLVQVCNHCICGTRSCYRVFILYLLLWLCRNLMKTLLSNLKHVTGLTRVRAISAASAFVSRRARTWTYAPQH